MVLQNHLFANKFDVTDSTAGKVTTRLAQWYGGQDFKNPQLQDIKRNNEKKCYVGINLQNVIIVGA